VDGGGKWVALETAPEIWMAEHICYAARADSKASFGQCGSRSKGAISGSAAGRAGRPGSAGSVSVGEQMRGETSPADHG